MSENPRPSHQGFALVPKWRTTMVYSTEVPGGEARVIFAECDKTGSSLEGYLERIGDGKWDGQQTFIAPDGARFSHEADLIEHLRRQR